MMKKIAVPPQLQADTQAAMQQVLAGKRSSRSAMWLSGRLAFAAVFVMLGGFLLLQQFRDPVFKTNLSENHMAYVELRDGYLSFAEGTQIETGDLNAGLINPLRKSWTIEEYQDYLNKSPELIMLPARFQLAADNIVATYQISGEVVSATGSFDYRSEDGGYLRWVISDQVIAMPILMNAAAPNLSEVAGVRVTAVYDAAEDSYCVMFEVANRYYMLYSQAVSQEDFIRILYNNLDSQKK